MMLKLVWLKQIKLWLIVKEMDETALQAMWFVWKCQDTHLDKTFAHVSYDSLLKFWSGSLTFQMTS